MPRPLLTVLAAVMIPFCSFGQWTAQSSPTSYTTSDIYFQTASTGFLGTFPTSIYKTTNGGQTWSAPQYPGGALDVALLGSAAVNDIYFLDASNGIFAGGGFYNTYDMIARTTDGGATWRVAYSQEVNGNIRTPLTSVAFRDNTNGFVVGGAGVILKTIDAGQTWSKITSPTTKDLRVVRFMDSQTGFIAGDQVMLKTTNGGTTWQSIAMEQYVMDLHFFSATSGIASTTGGRILRTADGGTTWTAHPINFDATLGKMAFDGQTGYVIGTSTIYNRFILKTTDGGEVWEIQFDGSGNGLQGITIAPGGKVWAGGFSGSLYATTNSGGTGKPIASFTPPGTKYCQNISYTFTNNGPNGTYTYEWRVDGVLKSNAYHFTTTFATTGTHKVELTAIKGTFSTKTEVSFYTETSVDFQKALDLEVASTICKGAAATIVVKSPEWATYQLLQSTAVVAEDTDASNGVLLTTPVLSAAGTFRVKATRTNSCEAKEIYKDVTIGVTDIPTLGATASAVQAKLCNEGEPQVRITASKTGIRYALYQGNTLITSVDGVTGQTVVLKGTTITDATEYKVKASVMAGACESWFANTIAIDVEKVKADFYMPVNVLAGDPVNIENRSVGASTYKWTYTNATETAATGATPGPVHFYYYGTTTLEVKSAAGCTDTHTGKIGTYDPAMMDNCWAVGAMMSYEHDGYTPNFMKYSHSVASNGDILTTAVHKGVAELDTRDGWNYSTKNETWSTTYLTRYSPQGALKWTFKTGGYYENALPTTQVAAAPDGAIYLLATFSSYDPTFYSANGDSLQPYHDGNEYIYPPSQQYILKYTADGMLQWVKPGWELTGNMQGEQFFDIGVDQSSNVYVASDRVFKLSPAGTVLRDVPGFAARMQIDTKRLAISSDGSWYCIATQSSGVTIKRFKADGAADWENRVSQGGADDAQVDGSGNLLLCGGAGSATRFESKGVLDRTVDLSSFYLVKYGVNGKIIWINRGTGPAFYSRTLAVSDQGYVSVIPDTGSTGTYSITSQDGNNFSFQANLAHYLVTFDGTGNIVNTNKFLETRMNPSYLALANKGDQVYVLGAIANGGEDITVVNGDAIYNSPEGWGMNLFLAGIGQSCDISPSTLTGSTNLIYPKPRACVGSSFEVYFDTPLLRYDNEISVRLIDDYGFVTKIGSVTVQAGQANSGTIQVTIPTDQMLTAGYYTLRLWADKDRMYSAPIGDPFMGDDTSIEISEGNSAPHDFEYYQDIDLNYIFQISEMAPEYIWEVNHETFSTKTEVFYYEFPAAGSYEVCATWVNACGVMEKVCKTVDVNCGSGPVDFTYTADSKKLTFTGSGSDLDDPAWTFGDGQTATGLTTQHNYANYGSVEVCYSVMTGCGKKSVCKTITVACTQGAVNFTSSAVERAVTFTNTSAAEYTAFEWSFGDGSAVSNQKSPAHTYTNSGTYSVTLKSTGKCGEEKTSTQSVSAVCQQGTLAFTTAVNENVVTFTNTSATEYMSFSWIFNDGQSSSEKNPVHTYTTSGTYGVYLRSTGRCGEGNSFVKYVTVTCTQGALDFTSAMTGKTATFTNTSAAEYTSFAWTFGDGTTSTEKNPTHIYATTGAYTVTLKSTGKCNVQRTAQHGLTASCATLVTAAFTVNLNAQDVTVTNTATNATQYSWDFGDGSSLAQGASQTHHYATAGTYQICLTASNDCDSKSKCSPVTISTTSNPTSPAAPTNLTATAKDASSIALRWTDNATTETGYRVEYKAAEASAYQLSSTLVVNTTTHTVTGLNCDTDYLFRVGAVGQSNGIIYSTETKGRTTALSVSLEVKGAELYADVTADIYQWYRDGHLMVGEFRQTLTPPQNGQYKVKVAKGVCAAESEMVIFVVTAIEAAGNESVKIYPIPARDVLVMAFDEALTNGAANIKISSLTGMNLISVLKAAGNDRLDIPVSQLAPGVYLYTIDCPTRTIHGKITVQE